MPPTPRLEVGDKAPAFSLPDADGNTVKLSDYKGRKVIVYFYPAASTPGCTKEACDFRDNLAELNEAGLDVIGISPDKPAKLAKFRDAEKLTFPLLSDPDRKVLDSMGRLRREDDVRQDRPRRHPVDVRRRRERQDRGRAVQHPRHRPCRQATARPVGLSPSRSSSRASAVAARSSTPEVQALVDAVRLGVRVFDAGHQNLGRRERRGELRDERDRSADPRVDRLVAPGLPERGAGRVVDRAAGVDRVRLADVARRHGHLGTPRCVLLEVPGQRGEMLAASPPGATRMLTLARARGISVFDA